MSEEKQLNFPEITEAINLSPACDILSKTVKMDTEKITWTLMILLRGKGHEKKKRQEHTLMCFKRIGQTPRAI